MAKLNQITLQGNVTQDPSQYNDKSPVKFSIAADNGYNKDNPNDSFFIEVSLWGNQRDYAMKNLTKGTAVIVQGSLKEERWEKDGEQRKKFSVNANQFYFCGSKNDSSKPASESKNDSKKSPQNPDNYDADGEDDMPF